MVEHLILEKLKRKTRMETKQELRLQLIKELAECIALLTDEEYTYSVDYVVNRYLWNICTNDIYSTEVR